MWGRHKALRGARRGANLREMSHAEGPQARSSLALLGAVTAISTAAIGIRFADAWAPTAIAAGRVSVTALAMLPWIRHELPQLRAAIRRDPRVSLRIAIAGLLLAAHFGSWIASLGRISVLSSVALVTTQPLFAIVLGRWIGDEVSPRAWVGAAIAVGGGWFMSDGGGDFVGAALAVAGAGFAAAYLAVGRGLRTHVPLGAYFVAVHAIAAALLWLVTFVLGVAPQAWAPAGWWVLYLGIIPGVVGHGLLNWSVRRVAVHTVALMVLLEPVGSGWLAWLLLDEVPTSAELLGGALLLLGVGVGAWPSRSAPAVNAGDPAPDVAPPGTRDEKSG